MRENSGSAMSPRRRMLTMLSAFGLAVSLLIVTPATPARSAVEKPSDRLPAYGALIGTTTWPRDGDWAMDGVIRSWEYHEDYAGRDLDIGHFYYTWGADIISWRESYNEDNGRLSLVSWAPTQTSGVINGQWDAYIREQADLVKAFDGPILIRWAWEMDGNYRRSQMESPEKFIQAWRHIVQIFRDRNVNNAEFAWCPNAWAFDINEGPDWYPGDDWVDWLCADGYNWNPGRPGDPWISISVIFEKFHDWAVQKDKPVIIGEFAAMERNPGEKAAWMRSIPTELENNLPAIDAMVWFDVPGDYGDWWVDTSQSSFDAWKDIVNDPYFTDGLIFGDSFSSGLGAWSATTNAGLDQSAGSPSAPSLKLNAGAAPAYARKNLGRGQDAVCVDFAVRIKAQQDGAGLKFLRLQNSAEVIVARLYLNADGKLHVKSSKTGKKKAVGIQLQAFTWYDLTFCATRGVDTGNISVEVDGETLLDWDTRVSKKKIKALRFGGGGTAFNIRIDDVGVYLPQ